MQFSFHTGHLQVRPSQERLWVELHTRQQCMGPVRVLRVEPLDVRIKFFVEFKVPCVSSRQRPLDATNRIKTFESKIKDNLTKNSSC